MNTESQYEKMYNDLVAGLEKMHKRNVKRTSDALKSLFIIPTIFLIMLFLTKSSKTIFLVLWIASMFIIAAILIIIEYQDYLLRQMFSQVDTEDDEAEAAEVIIDEADSEDALARADQIRQSVQQRAPEYDSSEETPSEDFEYDNPEEAPVTADEVIEVEETADDESEVAAEEDTEVKLNS